MDYRDLMIELCDESLVDYREALIACLKYMSADDVKDMMRLNEFDTIDELDIPVQDPSF